MLLAAIVAVVLAAAVPALAGSGSANDFAKGALGKGDSVKGHSNHNKDFAGLVDIGGGRQMYMECQGKGSPTVVFVSGGGDRTAVDQPTTVQDGARDLHALLSASGERGPYVVVGHSMGGAISRQYASEYPQDVSGLVLIDYTPYDARRLQTDEQWKLWQPLLGSPSKEALASYPALEQNANQRNVKLVLAAAPLKPMPLIVLSSDEPYNLIPYAKDGTLPLTIAQAKEFGRVLFQEVLYARANLVSQVPGARHITNTDSGHYIHQEQPKLVIDSVREVVDAVGKKGCKKVGHNTLGS